MFWTKQLADDAANYRFVQPANRGPLMKELIGLLAKADPAAGLPRGDHDRAVELASLFGLSHDDVDRLSRGGAS